MKKLILFLLLLSCGFLYAETRTYVTGDSLERFCFNKSEKWTMMDYDFSKDIFAVLPYEGGCLLKLSHKDTVTSERYIYKGLKFYTLTDTLDKETRKTTLHYHECTIIDIKPNEFTVDIKEVYSEEL